MKKTVREYLSLPYTRELIKDDNGWGVRIKELEGCISCGENSQEALEMIDDALKLWIETALEENRDIPLPELMIKKSYSGKFALRMPMHIHKKLAEQAKKNGVSLNLYLVSLLSEKSVNETPYTISHRMGAMAVHEKGEKD